MLQNLAGRMTWEPVGGGIQVEIPAQRNWTILFFAAWLAMWTYGGRQAILQVLASAASKSMNWFLVFWLVGWLFGECFVIAAILWALGGSTTLTLDNSTLSVARQLFGLRVNGFSCMTSNVRNLRFSPAARRGRYSSQSAIKFETDDKTRSIASGISDAEAFALIDKMLGVYKFPKDRALEYMDSPT